MFFLVWLGLGYDYVDFGMVDGECWLYFVVFVCFDEEGGIVC